EPFYTQKQEGTGLGLSVSHRIIEGHNGTIYVTSIIGEGSTFTIQLPYLV
ncbi:MAG: ATP-binding protein, partial [Tumebacillaceae bacterium]